MSTDTVSWRWGLLENFVVFQAGWFACVLGGANHVTWIVMFATSMGIVLHLRRAARPATEFALIVLCGLMGMVLDSWPVALGLLGYPSGQLLANTAPYWIVAMWMLFGTTLNVTLRWLKKRPVLGVLLGLTAGPAAYFGGSKLGGVVFNEPQLLGLVAVAVNWAVAVPALMALSSRLDGMEETDQRPDARSACAK